MALGLSGPPAGLFVLRSVGLFERGTDRLRRLGADADHPIYLLFEDTKDDVDSADPAQQKLQDHTPGAGVNIKSEGQRKMQS